MFYNLWDTTIMPKSWNNMSDVEIFQETSQQSDAKTLGAPCSAILYLHRRRLCRNGGRSRGQLQEKHNTGRGGGGGAECEWKKKFGWENWEPHEWTRKRERLEGSSGVTLFWESGSECPREQNNSYCDGAADGEEEHRQENRNHQTEKPTKWLLRRVFSLSVPSS